MCTFLHLIWNLLHLTEFYVGHNTSIWLSPSSQEERKKIWSWHPSSNSGSRITEWTSCTFWIQNEDEVTLPRSDNLCSSPTAPFSSYIEPVEVAPGGFLRLQSQAREEMLFGEMRNCQLSRITTIFTRNFCIKNDLGILGHYCGYKPSSGQRRARWCGSLAGWHKAWLAG